MSIGSVEMDCNEGDDSSMADASTADAPLDLSVNRISRKRTVSSGSDGEKMILKEVQRAVSPQIADCVKQLLPGVGRFTAIVAPSQKQLEPVLQPSRGEFAPDLTPSRGIVTPSSRDHSTASTPANLQARVAAIGDPRDSRGLFTGGFGVQCVPTDADYNRYMAMTAAATAIAAMQATVPQGQQQPSAMLQGDLPLSTVYLRTYQLDCMLQQNHLRLEQQQMHIRQELAYQQLQQQRIAYGHRSTLDSNYMIQRAERPMHAAMPPSPAYTTMSDALQFPYMFGSDDDSSGRGSHNNNSNDNT